MSIPAEELSCQELVELITAYLEHALAPVERARFEAHLSGCEGCRNYLGQMRLTIATLGTLPPQTIPPAVRSQLLEAFREWKRARP
jgi:predicted anti-sigma-YlaC factor YlaD